MEPIIIAFAMYSKIPVPNVEWSDKNMRYALSFLPLIGIVTGIGFYILYYICTSLEFAGTLKGAILTAVPILITGGIHADGYIDTVDAYLSFAEREKRLEILKDPHVGAFAVIYAILYFMLYAGFASEIGNSGIHMVCAGFVTSRSLSGIGALTVKKAKSNGLLHGFTEKAVKNKSVLILSFFFIASAGYVMFFSVLNGAALLIVSAAVFLYYRNFAVKNFGGATGDLAGYFLQIYELSVLIVAVVLEKAAV